MFTNKAALDSDTFYSRDEHGHQSRGLRGWLALLNVKIFPSCRAKAKQFLAAKARG